MKIYIWENSVVGGGWTIVVLASTIEEAKNIVRNSSEYNTTYSSEVIKGAPTKEVSLEQPKIITYFDYYE